MDRGPAALSRQAAGRLLGVGDLQRRSYAPDWSIAQVLSYLGSQAEIFGLFLDAGLSGEDPPGTGKLKGAPQPWRPPNRLTVATASRRARPGPGPSRLPQNRSRRCGGMRERGPMDVSDAAATWRGPHWVLAGAITERQNGSFHH